MVHRSSAPLTVEGNGALLFAAEGAVVVGCDLKADDAEDDAEETVELVCRAGLSMTSTRPLDLTNEPATTAWVDKAASGAAPATETDPLASEHPMRGAGPHPARPVGPPEEVARCAPFLISDDASSLTGTNLIVHGGWSVVLPGA